MDGNGSGNGKDAAVSNGRSKSALTNDMVNEDCTGSTSGHVEKATAVKRVSFQNVKLDGLPRKPSSVVSGQTRMAAQTNRGKRMTRKTCIAKSTRPGQTNSKSVPNDGLPPSSNVDTEVANVYARPELNTALQLAEQIQTLEMACFDGDAAVDARLAGCPSTRRKLAAASLCPLNFGRHEELYDGVLHLSFDEEAVLRAAAQELDAKARAIVPAPRPRDPEPRIEEYLSEDVIEPQFARFPVFGIDDLGFDVPETAPKSASYNLYRHQRMWQGLFQ